jgi:hypothetical protein
MLGQRKQMLEPMTSDDARPVGRISGYITLRARDDRLELLRSSLTSRANSLQIARRLVQAGYYLQLGQHHSVLRGTAWCVSLANSTDIESGIK